ncbi:Dienelactone hydrolase [Parasponia andersonii]|uniref:Dienelactone hydrolase n=1 Tax=Parasponia andersonii TaxID=3476 RepID=A0A2P5E3T0_PARAD|nr:Dienelactone hydrolase [Parasponia andersonii]
MSGPQCLTNPPTLNASSGLGHVYNLGGLPSYVVGFPDPKLAMVAIVLVSDVYGYETPNLRKIADKAAAAGFFVAVPDFLKGDPYNRENTSRPIPVWIKDHSPEEGSEKAKVVIKDLKSKGFSAIGFAGFCWGGKVVVELAKTDSIRAAMLLHPSFVTVDDIKEVKVPLAILGAEFDGGLPPKLLKQFEAILKEKHEIESFVKIFPGVKHGWTLRYNASDEAARKSADEAHHDLIQWFRKTIK